MDVSSPLARNCSSGQSILLSEDTGNIQYRGKAVIVNLTESSISIINIKTDALVAQLDLNSVIGAHYTKHAKHHETSEYVLQIFSYEIHNGCCTNRIKDGDRRRKVTCELRFESGESLCCKWANAINTLVQDASGALSFAEDGESICAPRERKYLCFVNPVGGKKEGMKIWTKTVRPMLEEASIRIHLIVTEYADHAKAVVADIDLMQFDAILTVGGDGLLFEVVNGIAAREEGEALLRKVTLIPIPGGTGNGLAKSILHECKEYYSALNATFVAVKGVRQPMDLSRNITADGKVSYAFLILGWGLISDIDILSETMRCLGEPRLYIAAVYFIIRKRRYAGRLRMKLATGDEGANRVPITPPPSCGWGGGGGGGGISPPPTTASSSSSSAAAVSGVSDTDTNRAHFTSGNTVRHRRHSEDHGDDHAHGGDLSNPVHSTKSSLGNSNNSPDSNSLNKAKQSDSNSLIASASDVKMTDSSDNHDNTSSADDCEGSWITIEGEFVLVWVVQTSHATSSMNSGPGVTLADGVFTVFVVQEMSRLELVDLLISADDGKHIDHPKVKTYKCTAYSLEPLTEEGIFSLDGEVVPYGRIESAVIPSAANIMQLRS